MHNAIAQASNLRPANRQVLRLEFGRRICLAPMARHSSPAWGKRPGSMDQKNPSAEGATH